MIDDDLKQQLLSYPDLELAILFGSVADGAATEASDLDLAVQFPQPLTSEQKRSIISDLALLTGRPIDLIDLKTVGEPLLGQIFKGRRILGSTTEYGKLLSRHLKDVADFLPLYEQALKIRRDRWINS
jgi:predicted nucleotidyltransferase